MEHTTRDNMLVRPLGMVEILSSDSRSASRQSSTTTGKPFKSLQQHITATCNVQLTGRGGCAKPQGGILQLQLSTSVKCSWRKVLRVLQLPA